jgi:enoyl-CoA hydratase/carnithine racemase
MIETRSIGDVVEIKLARPPVNAFNDAMLTAIHDALAAAMRGPARALVLSGRPGMFSAGLDVPSLLGKNPAEMRAFWRLFFDVQRQIAGFPVPIACAITGHSPAGGAVLAMYCDYRVMAQGAFKIGLNEVAVGIHPGPVIHGVLRRVVGARRAELLLASARMLTPDEALAIGLVDELAAPEEVVDRAIAWAQSLASLPAAALAATRALARADLIEIVRTAGIEGDEALGDHWFEPETQAALRAMVARLKK